MAEEFRLIARDHVQPEGTPHVEITKKKQHDIAYGSRYFS